MSIESISANTPYPVANALQKSQGDKELTTVTTHCEEEHAHDRSCPHTVSTQPAPRFGTDGYLLDEKV